MRASDLFESYDYSLYHGTGADSAVKIILDNVMKGMTEHDITSLHGGYRNKDINVRSSVRGVSLTRSPAFARKWKNGQGVVFILDNELLRKNYRLMSVNFYRNRSESEEFVVGDIKNISRYVKEIQISQQTYDELVQEDEDNGREVWCYYEIYEHPKINILGARWDSYKGTVFK